MIRLPNAPIIFLAFGLAFTVGCHWRLSAEAPQQSSLSPVAQEIQRRGYHAKESLIVPPTPWEISTFRLRHKGSFAFRADRPQSGTSDYFVRFRLFEEDYDSIEDARHRLANLHLPSPDAPAEVNEYDRVMRSGFRVGTVVYFLQTDAIIFWDEVQRFAKELAAATQGAELTRAAKRNDDGGRMKDELVAVFSSFLVNPSSMPFSAAANSEVEHIPLIMQKVNQVIIGL